MSPILIPIEMRLHISE